MLKALIMQIALKLPPVGTAVQTRAKVAGNSFSAKLSSASQFRVPQGLGGSLNFGQHHRVDRNVSVSALYQEEGVIEEVDFDVNLTNSFTLMGNVGRKPDIKFLENGSKVAQWTLAMNDRKTNATHWFDVEAWGALAERAASELDQGQKISVQGPLRIREYTDGQGIPRKALKITANTVKRIKPLRRDAQSNSWQQQQAPTRQPSYQAQPDNVSNQAASMPPQQMLATTEELWMNFFEDTSGWYDNRPRKIAGEMNPKSPDFKRKDGGRDAPALWIESRGTPAWVRTELQKLDTLASDVPPF